MSKNNIWSLVFMLVFICGCFPTKNNLNENTGNYDKDIVIDVLNADIGETNLADRFSLVDKIQDGCIFNDTLFLFNSIGTCYVYNINDNYSLICETALPDYCGFVPHSNCVCFGSKVDDSDDFPLLYTNVYNNYSNNPYSYGMCFVYRIFVQGYNYQFNLVQVIKLSFSNDNTLWNDDSFNISPFGNFLIDNDKLIVYLNIFSTSKTRFFVLPLPTISNELFVEIDSHEICYFIDTQLFKYIQGGTIHNKCILSLEGFGTIDFPAVLRIINLNNKLLRTVFLDCIIGEKEPEFISIYNEYLFIGEHNGEIFSFDLSNFIGNYKL